jgi:uncharacterized repeat protein (TIGR01451 family)
MKKTIYLSLCALFAVMLSATSSKAQYTITGNSITHYCVSEYYTVTTSAPGWTSGMTLQTYFGDGTSTINPADSSPVYFSHTYDMSGVYTVKHVLIYSGVRMDSVTVSDTANVCKYIPVTAYLDNNSNCIDDLGDLDLMNPYTVEVDSAGVPVETITATNIFYITAVGVPTGTVYTFRVLTPPTGLVTTCPLSGVSTYTIGTTTGPVYFGFECATTTGFDIRETVHVGGPGRHMADVNMILDNAFCTAHAGTLTLTFSPKYNFTYSVPAPTSVVGNVVTYNFPALSLEAPIMLHAHFDVPSVWLVPGDTIHSSYVLTPTTGDLDPSNNTITRIDTVVSSYDPNEKSVSPKGIVSPGTTLTYTIQFENTGNAPAKNIHIQDTLSPNVDPTTFKLVKSSAAVTTTLAHVGGLYILKFDFANINLPDSTHHGECDGLVIFTIKAKSGLPAGTVINNEAGIYFDDNEVVMTNKVQNVIGIPTSVAVMTNTSNVNVYPNPVSDELTVKVDNGNYSTLSISNTVGQVVLNQSFSTTQTKVNVKTLAPGIYYITLRGESGVKVQKFEKQ